MPSALIRSECSYPAVPLVEQLVHQRFVLPGPLVLRKGPLTFQRPQRIGDRTVSRRSEPSSRTALIGEQPNPWDLLQPQDAMSRHRTLFSIFTYGADYIFILHSMVGNLCHNLSFDFCKSRRVSGRFLSYVLALPFRVSRYGVNHAFT